MVSLPDGKGVVNTHILWHFYDIPKGLEPGTNVRIRLVPTYKKSNWYQRGHGEDKLFLDEVIELELPVRKSRSR